MKVQIEEVSPSQAAEWLKLSKGNRRLNENYVLTLAVAMDGGGWIPEASEVVFDATGALIDGHHRLSAVATLGKSVEMAVKRGVPPEVRNVLDTGRTRSMSDLLGMYRGSLEYPQRRKAILTACMELLMGGSRHRPALRTLDSFDEWMKHFRAGVEWVVPACLQADHPHVTARAFAIGPVAGAFAFAHKTDTPRVVAFFERCIRGEGLSATEPAFTLRNYILEARAQARWDRSSRRDVALKVLSATYAELHGATYKRLQVSATALEFFRQAYKSRALDKLVEPWAVPTPEASR